MLVSCIPATCFKIVCSACPRVCPAGTHSFPESALFCFILFYFILFSSSLSFFPQGVRLVQETCESGVIHSLDVPGIFRVFMCFFRVFCLSIFSLPLPHIPMVHVGGSHSGSCAAKVPECVAWLYSFFPPTFSPAWPLLFPLVLRFCSKLTSAAIGL